MQSPCKLRVDHTLSYSVLHQMLMLFIISENPITNDDAPGGGSVVVRATPFWQSTSVAATFMLIHG